MEFSLLWLVLMYNIFVEKKFGGIRELIREGCLAWKYSWIAMVHYANVKESADRLMSKEGLDSDIFLLSNKANENAIVTVTMAAMALEAFFNDYAACRFGDKFFYDNFEGLRPIGKLQLISKFFFEREVDKGKLLYQRLDKLFKLRNSYVHNKSRTVSGVGMTEVEIKKMEEIDPDISWILPEEKEFVKKVADDARNAISAIYETAKYFEEHDEEGYTYRWLLWENFTGEFDEEEFRKVKSVQREFGIPEIKRYEDIM